MAIPIFPTSAHVSPTFLCTTQNKIGAQKVEPTTDRKHIFTHAHNRHKMHETARERKGETKNGRQWKDTIECEHRLLVCSSFGTQEDRNEGGRVMETLTESYIRCVTQRKKHPHPSLFPRDDTRGGEKSKERRSLDRNHEEPMGKETGRKREETWNKGAGD